ncbi:hypothetical protein LLS1_27500 [Leifsonia sp. LS1]|nr:hypothetical protein LLS1_27500 [Leifsonia sp. LS1]
MNDTIIRPGGTADLAGHSVARIGYGAMALERFSADPDGGVRLLRRAVELGIDHIDTADFYGDSISNDLIRRAIRPADDVVVVTKVGALKNPGGPIPLRPGQRPEQLRQAVEDNLRTLGRERLDVVNLRRLDVGPGVVAEGEQVVDLDDQLAALIALRDAGTIRAIGLSAVDEPDGGAPSPPASCACRTPTASSTGASNLSCGCAPTRGSHGCRSSRSAPASPASPKPPSSPRWSPPPNDGERPRRRSDSRGCSVTPPSP